MNGLLGLCRGRVGLVTWCAGLALGVARPAFAESGSLGPRGKLALSFSEFAEALALAQVEKRPDFVKLARPRVAELAPKIHGNRGVTGGVLGRVTSGGASGTN